MTETTMIEEARRMLGDVQNGRKFVLKDGSAMGSVRELYTRLKDMDDEVFSHHVHDNRNDFGNWVKDVFRDYQLANELFTSSTRSECLGKVGTRIYQLEKMTAPPGKVMLIPAPAKPSVKQPNKTKPVRKKRSKMDVDPAELEKTIQTINQRYWEKKKLEEIEQKKEEESILKPLQEPEKTPEKMPEQVDSEDDTRSVEDLLETYDPERLHTTLLKDAKNIFSASTVKDTALDVKKLFARDKKERVETDEVIKSVSTRQNPDKDMIIAGLQKAHRMEPEGPRGE